MNKPIVLGLTHRLVILDGPVLSYGDTPEDIAAVLDTCRICGHEDSLWTMPVDVWGRTVCWNCADNHYLNCPHCGFMYPEKDMLIIEDGVPYDELYCPSCANKALGITIPSSQLALPQGYDFYAGWHTDMEESIDTFMRMAEHLQVQYDNSQQAHGRSLRALHMLAERIAEASGCEACPVDYCELGFSDDSGVNPDGSECVALITSWATEQVAKRENNNGKIR